MQSVSHLKRTNNHKPFSKTSFNPICTYFWQILGGESRILGGESRNLGEKLKFNILSFSNFEFYKILAFSAKIMRSKTSLHYFETQNFWILIQSLQVPVKLKYYKYSVNKKSLLY